MGKKSLVDAPLLPSAERQGLDELEVSMPAEQSALAELFQELVQVALRTQVDTQEGRSEKQVNDIDSSDDDADGGGGGNCQCNDDFRECLFVNLHIFISVLYVYFFHFRRQTCL